MPKYTSSSIRVILLLLLAVSVWHEGHVSAAVASTPTADLVDGVATMAVMLMTVIEFLTFFIFSFLSVLLDPLFVMDFAATEALRNIWIYCRDLMNVLFAFMLITAGIYTVVTGNKELVQSKWKKFILAVILVNFSWFFPRVIFDAANVLTATIYQIPSGLSNGVVECRHPPTAAEIAAADPGERPEGKPCKVYTDVTYGREECDKKLGIPRGGYDSTAFGYVCYKTANWDEETNTAYGMLNGLVMNYGRLPDLPRVLAPKVGAGAVDKKDLRAKNFAFILHIIFVVLLMLMLFLPLAAMFVVFMVRIPILWVTVAFMPFMFLGFVMGEQMKGFDSMKIFHKFVTAAFLPAAVAVPFAAGFLVLSQVTQIDCHTTVAAAAGFCNKTGPLVHGIDTLWSMLMLLIGFFIIWMGFWAALSIDPIYEGVTKGIKGFGESVGKIGMKLPLSVPILPIGKGGERKSVFEVKAGVDAYSRRLSGGMSPFEAARGTGAKNDDEIIKALNAGGSKTNQELGKILAALEAPNTTKGTIEGKLNHIIQNEPGVQAELREAGVENPKAMSHAELMPLLRRSGNNNIQKFIELYDAAPDTADADAGA